MKPRAVAVAWMIAGVLSLGLAACATRGPLKIEPVQATTAVVQPHFDTSYYRQDRDGTLYFVARGATTDRARGEKVEQIVTARTFWKPVGGRTSLNTYSLNTTFRYVLIRPEGVGLYEGAGFVRLSGKPGAPHLTARVMDADLRLTQASAGFKDTLGRSRLVGTLPARYSDVETMDQILQAHQEFFLKSLRRAAPVSTAPAAPAGGPATQPSTTAPATGPARE